ncbi:hypothetical protein FGG08_001105 [Glutinoglossum americanum]|uniref:Uncharacterized protein n=1 Tax=Glutinoglossum americanum TaxID=1670608 RepID=A0A9P8L0J6_9PEZI|nr:hypothetical protein FGG08_001105 [Glutinoglossum americanum]
MLTPYIIALSIALLPSLSTAQINLPFDTIYSVHANEDPRCPPDYTADASYIACCSTTDAIFGSGKLADLPLIIYRSANLITDAPGAATITQSAKPTGTGSNGGGNSGSTNVIISPGSKSGLSTADKIGIGVGVPSAIFALFGAYFTWKAYRKNKREVATNSDWGYAGGGRFGDNTTEDDFAGSEAPNTYLMKVGTRTSRKVLAKMAYYELTQALISPGKARALSSE